MLKMTLANSLFFVVMKPEVHLTCVMTFNSPTDSKLMLENYNCYVDMQTHIFQMPYHLSHAPPIRLGNFS